MDKSDKLEKLDEINAIQKAQQGDKESFRFLVEQYQKQALSTAVFLTHHFYTAQDTVQEAFVQCYLHLSELREPTQFKWWFFRILTRTAWRKKEKDTKTIPIADIFPAKEKELEERRVPAPGIEETDAGILPYLAQLEEKQRAVLVLYYFNDFSVKEIAKILGCLEGTVKSRLYHGRQKLKDTLLAEKYPPALALKNRPTTTEKEVSL